MSCQESPDSSQWMFLYVEAEVHDVSVLHYVFLAFHAQFSGFAYGGFAAILDVVFVFDDFGADETFLKVCMDDTGALRSFPAFTVGPCLYFHFAGGDEGFKVQQAINGFNQSVAATFFQAEVFEEHLFLFVSFQFGNVGFGLGGDYDELGIFTLNGLTYLLHILIAACGACIVHVADVKYRFGGKQEHLFGALLLIIVLRYYGAGALSLFQCIFVTEQEFVFHFCQFVATYFCYFFPRA